MFINNICKEVKKKRAINKIFPNEDNFPKYIQLLRNKEYKDMEEDHLIWEVSQTEDTEKDDSDEDIEDKNT